MRVSSTWTASATWVYRRAVPVLSLLCIAIASGLAAAIAARTELRVSPRPSFLTRSFGAYLIFAFLALIPVSVYFYVFHGDWFLLYLIDVKRIPSAVALVGFVVEAGLGALAYMLGAWLVRNQREQVAVVLATIAIFGAGGIVPAVRDRLTMVGTIAQFRGGFGLEPFQDSVLFRGTITMGVILVFALIGLLARIHMSGRRRA